MKNKNMETCPVCFAEFVKHKGAIASDGKLCCSDECVCKWDTLKAKNKKTPNYKDPYQDYQNTWNY
jgi:hypothetical protein